MVLDYHDIAKCIAILHHVNESIAAVVQDLQAFHEERVVIIQTIQQLEHYPSGEKEGEIRDVMMQLLDNLTAETEAIKNIHSFTEGASVQYEKLSKMKATPPALRKTLESTTALLKATHTFLRAKKQILRTTMNFATEPQKYKKSLEHQHARLAKIQQAVRSRAEQAAQEVATQQKSIRGNRIDTPEYMVISGAMAVVSGLLTYFLGGAVLSQPTPSGTAALMIYTPLLVTAGMSLAGFATLFKGAILRLDSRNISLPKLPVNT